MNIVFKPFIVALNFLFVSLYNLTGNYGYSLIIMSFVTSLLMAGFRYILRTYPDREQNLQRILEPQLDKIKQESTGHDRHKRIMGLYNRYGYHPIFALRSAIPVFIQLPFLFAAFYVLNNFSDLAGESFFLLKDLSKPDNLKFGVNLLPFLMTLVNIFSSFLTPGFNKKARGQAIGIALFFLILLYSSASALLLYWTMNNVFFFLGVLIKRARSGEIILKEKEKSVPFTIRLKALIEKTLYSDHMKIITSAMLLFQVVRVFSVVSTISDLNSDVVFQTKVSFFGVSILFWIFNISGLLKKSNRINGFLKFIITFSVPALIAFCIVAPKFLSKFMSVSIDFKFIAAIVSVITNTFVVIVLFVRNYRTIFKKGHWQALLVTIIFTLIPVVNTARLNFYYLNGLYYVWFFLTLLLVGIFSYFWTLLFTRGKEKLLKAAVFSALFIHLFIMLPTIRSITAWQFGIIKTSIEFGIIYIILYSIISFFDLRKIFTIFRNVGAIVLIVFIIIWIHSLVKSKPLLDSSLFEVPEELSEIKMETTPNIYLFVYDGMPNNRVFDIVNINNSRMDSIFKKYKFKHYKDTYTLGKESVGSMGALFNMSKRMAKHDGRNSYRGYSVVNKVLRENGYKTFVTLDHYLIGKFDESIKEVVDEIFPPNSNAKQLNFVLFNQLSRAIFSSSWDASDVGVHDKKNKMSTGEFQKAMRKLEDDMQANKHELIQRSMDKAFVINHCEKPMHTLNTEPLSKTDTLKWIRNYNIALEYMEKDFEYIEKYDPNSIVIAIGDHGPGLTGEGAAKWSVGIWKEGDADENNFWDRFGTLVAIRWPDQERAEKYDGDLVLNQDIFSVVFSYMADNSKYLKFRPDRTCDAMGLKFREGKIIYDTNEESAGK